MSKYTISYWYCSFCGFLQTETPYWLQEAYVSSINNSDTGIVVRNQILSKRVAVILYHLASPADMFLDYAGGYGLFTRMMRDFGYDFYWQDKYTQNLLARGFEYISQPISGITSFESFEHFVNPLQEIDKMLDIAKNIIFSTVLLPLPIPQPLDWWYYGLDHGQHISFYSKKTFEYIAQKKGLHFYTNGVDFHMFLHKKLPECSLLKKKLLRLLARFHIFISSQYDFELLLDYYDDIFIKNVQAHLHSRTLADYNFLIGKNR